MNKSINNPDSTDIIVPYDGGDIWVKRTGCLTGEESTITVAIHPASGLKTNVQRSIIRHSPTGFNFGYGGSGPADLALNICRMFCTNREAEMVYQDFKFKFCISQGDELIIPKSEILAFLIENEIEPTEQ